MAASGMDAYSDYIRVGRESHKITAAMYVIYQEFMRSHHGVVVPVAVGNDLTYQLNPNQQPITSDPDIGVDWPPIEAYHTITRFVSTLVRLGLACVDPSALYDSLIYICERNPFNHRKHNVLFGVVPNIALVPFCSVDHTDYIERIVQIITDHFSGYADLVCVGEFVKGASTLSFISRLSHLSEMKIDPVRLVFPVPTTKSDHTLFKAYILGTRDDPQRVALTMMMGRAPASYGIVASIIHEILTGETKALATRDEIDGAIDYGKWMLLDDEHLMTYYNAVLLYVSDAGSSGANQYFMDLLDL